MSSETENYEDRNPSPPPEILKNDGLLPDRIGNSMYSKHWLYKTLMNIMKTVDASTETKNEIVELDSIIEEDSCTLWDMSANLEVAEFLLDCGVIETFIEVIDKTQSPRLLEILIGILGNMSSFDSVCQNISENKNLLHLVFSLSGTSDSPTLLQVFRFIHCGIANEKCKEIWLDLLEENSNFMDDIKFVLENNLNTLVLKGAFELLDRVLNEKVSYCNTWGVHTHAIAIIEASKQLVNSGNYEDLDQVFCTLNTICQQSRNVETYAENFAELQPLFEMYILKLGEEETLPQHTRLSSVTSFFAVYGTLLMSSKLTKEIVSVSIDALKAARKIFLSAKNIVKKCKENQERIENTKHSCQDANNKSQSLEKKNYDPSVTNMNVDDIEDFETLLEVLDYTAIALSSFVEKENEKSILNDICSKKIDVEHEKTL